MRKLTLPAIVFATICQVSVLSLELGEIVYGNVEAARVNGVAISQWEVLKRIPKPENSQRSAIRIVLTSKTVKSEIPPAERDAYNATLRQMIIDYLMIQEFDKTKLQLDPQDVDEQVQKLIQGIEQYHDHAFGGAWKWAEKKVRSKCKLLRFQRYLTEIKQTEEQWFRELYSKNTFFDGNSMAIPIEFFFPDGKKTAEIVDDDSIEIEKK